MKRFPQTVSAGNSPDNRSAMRSSPQKSDETHLREQARKAIRTGKLPNRRPDGTWGGPGIGVPCTICGAPVEHHEVELEIEFTDTGDQSPSKHHVHIRCFALWESEREKLEQGSPAISSCPQRPPAALDEPFAHAWWK